MLKKNSSERFCGDNFASGGGRASFENLFSPLGRVKCARLILADCCGSAGLQLTRNENLSEQVCRLCGCKIRNVAELYSFIQKAVSNTNVKEDVHWEAVEYRNKRQLPTAITPERSDVGKKRLESDGEQLTKGSPGKDNSRKTLFAESWTVSDLRDADWELLVLKHFIHRCLSK